MEVEAEVVEEKKEKNNSDKIYNNPHLAGGELSH